MTGLIFADRGRRFHLAQRLALAQVTMSGTVRVDIEVGVGVNVTAVRQLLDVVAVAQVAEFPCDLLQCGAPLLGRSGRYSIGFVELWGWHGKGFVVRLRVRPAMCAFACGWPVSGGEADP